ncbi:MAG: helix-turn-helix domain-containing protein [Rhodoplanes sp.]|uniref:helix-turn-helix transcriptional regulator n=1 Tax=Rhodoplanes sp. TaxID=1968906 RepID=UPI0017DB387D|nr:helix-turn-helix transcriptional regulator [Rhodoplanes sp.]NVO16781.1 helix-turn-helix domain-containing protein [Rhodoplanes sp.]
MSAPPENPFGSYLKARRAKLDPVAFGLPLDRRRTPGLRREEVAQRAHVSATWYTWLEQGRGGAPSADVLDRIARALMLTEVEREHLFLLALGRPPEVRRRPAEGVTPRLQRLLDAFTLSPAYVKTSTWDIIAWNRAAAAVLVDYGALAAEQRNALRLVFCNPRVRAAMPNWETDARFVVAAFRADTARAGMTDAVKPLVDELCRLSPDFEAMWRDNDVRGAYGETPKQVRHPIAGPIALEYSGFTVDCRPDLGLVVYNPATPADADRIAALLRSEAETSR